MTFAKDTHHKLAGGSLDRTPIAGTYSDGRGPGRFADNRMVTPAERLNPVRNTDPVHGDASLWYGNVL